MGKLKKSIFLAIVFVTMLVTISKSVYASKLVEVKFTVTPLYPDKGDSQTYEVQIKNTGTSSVNVQVTFTHDGSDKQSSPAQVIDPGRTGIFTWKWTVDHQEDHHCYGYYTTPKDPESEFCVIKSGVGGVGGVVVPVDKFGLLAPYVGLVSTITVTTVVTAVYVRRVKRRKEKQ
jgi:hypothetical protein